MIDTPPHIDRIIRAMEKKGHVVFSGAGKDLNLVGIRNTADRDSNEFNDWFAVFWMNRGRWEGSVFSCTTDPGSYYRENLANPAGTAILKPGQYRGSHKIGLHRGKYKALVQCKNVTVWRDDDGDNQLEGGKEHTGMFGINIHRAGKDSVNVDKWSAGCTVIQDDLSYDYLMSLCDEAAETWGDVFSYTLIESSDLD